MPSYVYIIIICCVLAFFALFFIISFSVRAIINKINKKSGKYNNFEGALKVSNSDDDFGSVLNKAMSVKDFEEFNIL